MINPVLAEILISIVAIAGTAFVVFVVLGMAYTIYATWKDLL